MSWFREDQWTRWKEQWERRRIYEAPPLVNSFLIIYEKGMKKVGVSRLLVPEVEADEKLLREMTRKDLRR